MKAFISPYFFSHGMKGYLSRLFFREAFFQQDDMTVIKLNGVQETPFFSTNSISVSFLELFREPHQYNSPENTKLKLDQLKEALLVNEDEYKKTYEKILASTTKTKNITLPEVTFSRLVNTKKGNIYKVLKRLNKKHNYANLCKTEDSSIETNLQQLNPEKAEYVLLTFETLDQLKKFNKTLPLKKIILYIPWLIDYRLNTPANLFQEIMTTIADKLDELISDSTVMTIQEPISESFFSSLIFESSFMNE